MVTNTHFRRYVPFLAFAFKLYYQEITALLTRNTRNLQLTITQLSMISCSLLTVVTKVGFDMTNIFLSEIPHVILKAKQIKIHVSNP